MTTAPHHDLFTAPQIDPLTAIADDPLDAIFREINSTAIPTPFVIYTDTREQQPFSFEGITAGANRSHRPLQVRWEWHCLGNHGGDYSLEIFTGLIRIERKNVDDFHSTVLGWPKREQRPDGTFTETGRRINFEKELHNLNQMQFSAVVVEAPWDEMMDSVKQWGKRTAEQNRASIEGFVRRFKHNFPRVHWEFHENRRKAEEATYEHLEYFWNKRMDYAEEWSNPRRRAHERKRYSRFKI